MFVFVIIALQGLQLLLKNKRALLKAHWLAGVTENITPLSPQYRTHPLAMTDSTATLIADENMVILLTNQQCVRQKVSGHKHHAPFFLPPRNSDRMGGEQMVKLIGFGHK